MSGKTGIEWTDRTWNPTVGCTRLSPGCKNCYAFKLHDMRHAAFQAGKKLPLQYSKPFTELQMMEDRLTDPLGWKNPCRVFVNSVSDLFHKDVPDEFIHRVFAVMGLAGKHTFQVLTKRADRMQAYVTRLAQSIKPLQDAARAMGYTFQFERDDGRKPINMLPWPIPNVWLGVSVEDAKRKDRIDLLRQTPAAIRFLSCEPLIGDLGHVDLTGIAWLICGGESGGTDKIRPMHPDWPLSLRDQCQAAGTAFFFKQWGDFVGGEDFCSGTDDKSGPTGIYADLQNGTVVREGAVKLGDWHSWLGEDEQGSLSDPISVRVGKKAAGRLLDGLEYSEFPS